MASGLENIETIESPFRRFVTTIGVFPTAFTDAMTYYECLAYLVKYLEDSVVPAVNENAEALRELQTLYVQLKSYVDNYFDNLDVQEEINNKLDQMAEAGTLQEIIGEYLNATAVWGFDTVADMKSSTNLVNGSYARTLGYTTLNDGGESLYKIRNITNEDVVDETHIIAIGSGTLIAELINPNIINPDDFTGANDNEKVQNAIDYACSLYANNLPVSIQLNRLFDITTPLVIDFNNKRLPFIFTSNNGGGFKKTNSGYLFNTTKSSVSDITFDKISFISNTGDQVTILESPKFINIKFNDCTFKNIDQAVYSDTYIQAISFNNCLITGGSKHFTEFKGSYYLNFNKCTIEYRVDSYLIYQVPSTITYNKQFFTNVSECIIEGFTGATSGFMNISAYEEVNIINNYFEALYHCINHVGNEWGGVLNIKNNRFFQSTSIPTYNTSGMIYLEPYEAGHIKMGTINFIGNKINNTYAIYIHDTVMNIVANSTKFNLVNYSGNRVLSSLTTATYTTDGSNANPAFNILPIFQLTGTNDNKYDRGAFWNIDNKIQWNEDFTVSGDTYTVYYILTKGVLYANSSITKAMTDTLSDVKLYFGVDVFQDDIYSVTHSSNKCNILSYFRYGSANGKYLNIQAQMLTGETGNRMFVGNVILIGRRG